MTFECYVPYRQEDLTVMEALGGEIEEFYFSLEELREECGEDSPATKIRIEGLELELDDGMTITFDDLSEN